jgi:hypothetical protein
MNSKLYEKDYRGIADPKLLGVAYSSSEIRRLDPEKDRMLLSTLARYGSGTARKMALNTQGLSDISEVTEILTNMTSDDRSDEMYWLLREQVLRVDDMDLLKETALQEAGISGTFAFCYLTGYKYPAPEDDSRSHRTFECGKAESVMDEEVRAFCEQMINEKGPFQQEAGEVLELMKG